TTQLGVFSVFRSPAGTCWSRLGLRARQFGEPSAGQARAGKARSAGHKTGTTTNGRRAYILRHLPHFVVAGVAPCVSRQATRSCFGIWGGLAPGASRRPCTGVSGLEFSVPIKIVEPA